MTKLTDPQKIKDYVVDTIRTGNKDRIQKVIKRYFDFLKEQKQKYSNEDIVKEAREIFSNSN